MVFSYVQEAYIVSF